MPVPSTIDASCCVHVTLSSASTAAGRLQQRRVNSCVRFKRWNPLSSCCHIYTGQLSVQRASFMRLHLTMFSWLKLCLLKACDSKGGPVRSIAFAILQREPAMLRQRLVSASDTAQTRHGLPELLNGLMSVCGWAAGAQVFGAPPPSGGRSPPPKPTPPSTHCLAAGSSRTCRTVTTGANTAAAAPPSSAPGPSQLSAPAILSPGFGSPMQPAFGSPNPARANSGAGSRAAATDEAENWRDRTSPAPFGSAAKSQPAFGFAALRSVSSKRSRSGDLTTADAL